ncbi:MAG: hypothetical protein ACYC54_11910 [Sedimentisphaerales bacterium]
MNEIAPIEAIPSEMQSKYLPAQRFAAKKSVTLLAYRLVKTANAAKQIRAVAMITQSICAIP